jgi:hypothetical protein
MCIGSHNFRHSLMYLFFVTHLPEDDHVSGQNMQEVLLVCIYNHTYYHQFLHNNQVQYNKIYKTPGVFRCDITPSLGETQRTHKNAIKIHKPSWLKIDKKHVTTQFDTVC